MPIPSKQTPIEPSPYLESMFSSKLATYQRCLREYYWLYIRNFESRFLYYPFMVGTCVHFGIERFMLGDDPEAVLDKTDTFVTDYLADYIVSSDQAQQVEMQRLIILGILRGYMVHYKDDPKNFKVTGTENSYSILLPTTRIPYVGTLDLESDGPNGSFIMDHKVYSQFKEHDVANLTQNTQVMSYMLLKRLNNSGKIAGMYYNMIRKPAIRQKKGSKNVPPESRIDYMKRVAALYTDTPQDYFWREPVVYDPKHEAAILNEIDTLTTMLQMRYNQLGREGVLEATNWPRNYRACGQYGDANVCPYWRLCRYHSDGNNIADQTNFRQRKGHERGDISRYEGDCYE